MCVCVCVFSLCVYVQVRTHWRSSRFFYGRNRVIQTALGKSEAEEYREGLSELAKVWSVLATYVQ